MHVDKYDNHQNNMREVGGWGGVGSTFIVHWNWQRIGPLSAILKEGIEAVLLTTEGTEVDELICKAVEEIWLVDERFILCKLWDVESDDDDNDAVDDDEAVDDLIIVEDNDEVEDNEVTETALRFQSEVSLCSFNNRLASKIQSKRKNLLANIELLFNCLFKLRYDVLIAITLFIITIINYHRYYRYYYHP